MLRGKHIKSEKGALYDGNGRLSWNCINGYYKNINGSFMHSVCMLEHTKRKIDIQIKLFLSQVMQTLGAKNYGQVNCSVQDKLKMYYHRYIILSYFSWILDWHMTYKTQIVRFRNFLISSTVRKFNSPSATATFIFILFIYLIHYFESIIYT